MKVKVSNKNQSLKPFMSQPEEQLLERIDRSLAQADAGMCIDAD